MTRLSPNFRLAEFTRSDEAAKRGLDNSPTSEHLANLHVTAHRKRYVDEKRILKALGKRLSPPTQSPQPHPHFLTPKGEKFTPSVNRQIPPSTPSSQLFEISGDLVPLS